MGLFWVYIGLISAGVFGAGLAGPPKLRAEIKRMSRQIIKKYDEYAAHKTGKPIRKRHWRN